MPNIAQHSVRQKERSKCIGRSGASHPLVVQLSGLAPACAQIRLHLPLQVEPALAEVKVPRSRVRSERHGQDSAVTSG
eukprot:3340678-Rhodomonas_salina.2